VLGERLAGNDAPNEIDMSGYWMQVTPRFMEPTTFQTWVIRQARQ
jgi:hypothetical protein